MPYDISKPDNLPGHVQKMPAKKQAQWVEVFNSAFDKCNKDGGDNCEESAMMQANGVVKGKKNALAALTDWFNEHFGPLDAQSPETEAAPTARAISMPDLWRQVCEQACDLYPEAMLLDLYEDSGAMFALFTHEGHLYRSPITIANGIATLEAWAPVEVQFADIAHPAEGGDMAQAVQASKSLRASTTIIRQADGRVRWFSVSCTAVLNRVGEIDSTALFDSFVENFNSGQHPPVIRQFFHAGEAYRVGVMDFVARDGKTLITSGLYDDSELARAEIVARENDPAYWGQSIGYDPTVAPVMLRVADGISIPTYTAGVLREESTLPESQAAALFTMTHTLEVNRMLNQTQFEAFVKLFGDEAKARAWLAEHPDATNRMIDQAGMIARGTPPAPVVTPEAETPAAPQAAPVTTLTPPAPEAAQAAEPVERTIEIDDDALTAIAERLTARPEFQALFALPTTLAGLSDQIASLSRDNSARNQEIQKRMAALEKDDGEKRAEWLADLPAALRSPKRDRVTYRPRDAHATETPDDGGVAASQLAEATLAGAKTRNVR